MKIEYCSGVLSQKLTSVKRVAANADLGNDQLADCSAVSMDSTCLRYCSDTRDELAGLLHHAGGKKEISDVTTVIHCAAENPTDHLVTLELRTRNWASQDATNVLSVSNQTFAPVNLDETLAYHRLAPELEDASDIFQILQEESEAACYTNATALSFCADKSSWTWKNYPISPPGIPFGSAHYTLSLRKFVRSR